MPDRFTLVPPAPAPADLASGLTAGGYLRLRRTSQRVAAILVGMATAPRGDIARAHRYADAEDDRVILTEEELARARRMFRFEPSIYLQLAQGLPTLAILCRGCGCSWTDPCDEPLHGPCSWVIGDADLCTRCQRKGQGR